MIVLRFVERVIGEGAMPHLSSFNRLRRAGWRGVALISEAIVALAAAAATVQVLPFRRAIRFGSVGLRGMIEDPQIQMLLRVERSVELASTWVPWRTVCLQKGLALQWMLRRRGVNARLHYGIGKDGAGALCAHVWVSAGGAMLIGSEQAPQFQTVAIYPL